MKLKVLYTVLVILWVFYSGFSQKLNLQKYSYKEGLIQSTVKQIESDNYGNLWLATNDGLSKFNGKTFTNYTSTNGLPSNDISSLLFVDEVLYIGTKKGFCSYNGNNIENTPIYKKIQGSVRKILYKKGSLHILTSRGYYILNIEQAKQTIDSVSVPYIIAKNPTDAEFDEDGNLWIATSKKGLFFIKTAISTKIPKLLLLNNAGPTTSINNERVQTANFNSENLLKGDNINCLEFDKDKNLLVSDWGNGIAYIKFDFINNRGFSANYIDFGVYTNNIQITRFLNIQKDDSGNLYFASDGFGLFKAPIDKNTNQNDFAKGSVLWLTANTGFFGDNPLCFKQDKYKNLWIGTLYDGIIKQSNKSSWSYNKTSGLEEERIISVFKSSDSSIWCGTHAGGAFRFKKREFKRCFWEQGISETIITSITEDDFGNIWLGTVGGGISIIRKEDVVNGSLKVSKKINSSEGLSNDYVSYLYTSKDGAVWIGYTGQNRIDRVVITKDLATIITPFEISDLVTSFNTSCITEDDDANIWVTSNEGVWVLNPKTEDVSNEYAVFRNIQTISKDWNGNMWLGSSDIGAIILKNKLPTPYFKKGIANAPEKISVKDDNISSNRINTILFAKDIVWLISNNGINEIKIDSYLNKIIGVNVYNKDQKFASYDNRPNTSIIDDEKVIWIGSVEGLNQYQNLNESEHLAINKSIPVYINSILIENTPIDWTDKSLFDKQEFESIKFDGYFNWYKVPKNLELDYNHSTIRFLINTDNIADQDQIMYRHKLIGYDKEWETSKSNEISYTSLPPGDYSLIIQASLTNDFSNSTEITYNFTVTPPFWKTKAFYILSIMSVISLFYFFVVTREKRLKKEKLKLELEVKARTYEIESKKKEIELQNSLIQGINNDLTDSIKYAQRIQQTILPDTTNLANYFTDHFIFYKPRNIVSGDYYWMKEIDGLVYMAVVDCTGHGVPGAFMSLITSSILNESVDPNITKHKPVKMLRYLRKEINARLNQNHGEHINDGLDIALICYNKEKETIEYVNANRPLYIISNNELVTIPSEKVTIGGYADFVSMIPSKVISVKKGDLLFMFTDGITDQFGGEKNKKYNPARLRQFFLSNTDLELSVLKEKLTKEISDWQGSYEQTDDILLMGIKI